MKHNKKRNVALVYEQLIRYISCALVEGRSEDARKAMDILKEHFARGTELYKEFRLFNSLMRTTVSSNHIAERIITEARKAAKNHNPILLEQEKGRLISSINKKLNHPNFYSIRVPDYRDLATVQKLLNSWRNPDFSSIENIVLHEEKAVDILLSEKVLPPLVISEGVNDLSLRILKKKFAEKINHDLTYDQLQMISLSVKGNQQALRSVLKETKKNAIESLQNLKNSIDNKVLNSKIESVKMVIESMDYKDTTESNVSKFLVMQKLIEEIKEEEVNET